MIPNDHHQDELGAALGVGQAPRTPSHAASTRTSSSHSTAQGLPSSTSDQFISLREFLGAKVWAGIGVIVAVIAIFVSIVASKRQDHTPTPQVMVGSGNFAPNIVNNVVSILPQPALQPEPAPVKTAETPEEMAPAPVETAPAPPVETVGELKKKDPSDPECQRVIALVNAYLESEPCTKSFDVTVDNRGNLGIPGYTSQHPKAARCQFKTSCDRPGGQR